MPRRLKAGNGEGKVTNDTAGKFRLYTVLYHINEAFEQILGQLQQLGQREVSSRSARPSADIRTSKCRW